MRSNGPVLLALPAFRGLTRKLILLALGVAAVYYVFGLVLPGFAGLMVTLFALHADQAIPLVWQFVTWPFIPESLLGLLFALLSLWYFGSTLEDERGKRWFSELFFFSTIGGAVLATVISLTVGRYVTIIHAAGKDSSGFWPIVLALLVAYACLHPDESLSFNFLFRARAKYIAAGFLIIYLIFDFYIVKRFDALNTLCDTLFAWLFLQIAPRKGLRHAVAERWFGVRNSYYRSKRRRAAKKFQVYMRKQGKDVSIDDSGRYIGLDDDDRGPQRNHSLGPDDPTDKRHMN